MTFDHLLSPIHIGKVTVRNRVVFPPIDVALHREDRMVDQRYIDFLVDMVKDNGVGMLISEFTAVATDKLWIPASRIDKDEFIPGFQKMVDSVHKHGATIFLQIALMGGRAATGRAIAPSAIKSPLYPRIPEELSIEEVRGLVQKWREAAVRAKKCGFDGVEVHGGHDYLVGAFMSPHSNRRQDVYGGDFEGRMRFPDEIIRGIKQDCGSDFPVGVKFSAFEALENGITGPLSIDIAEHLEKQGADYLHVSSSTYMLAGTDYPDVPPLYVPEGPLVVLAEQIKKRVKVPVIAVAGISSPQVAEEIVARRRADLVGVGRAMFADPAWAAKVNARKSEEITPCIRCNVCHKRVVIDRAGEVVCTVNPGLLQNAPLRAPKSKRILVVGAGPAGLEAALTAAQRGHMVTLYEKAETFGGCVRLGCIPPFKRDLARLLDHYGRRLSKSSVRFVPGREMTVADAKSEKADEIIIAVGGRENVPPIPGVGQESVVKARDFYRSEALQGKSDQRAVVIGAGEVGCEIALFLSLLGRPVCLVDVFPRGKWFIDQHPTNRMVLLEQLAKNGVQFIDEAKDLRIDDGRTGSNGKVVRVERQGIELAISTQLIVLATGYLKEESLFRELGGAGSDPHIHAIGDCANPRNIHWAVHEGYKIGMRV
jgi:2,4-dienoyl-CoA reductase-like NADH-dependent reductase (Old Yellow Enzyme family)/thioredoxin reductase